MHAAGPVWSHRAFLQAWLLGASFVSVLPCIGFALISPYWLTGCRNIKLLIYFLVQRAVILAFLYRGQLSVFLCTEGKLSVLLSTEGSCPCFLVQRTSYPCFLYRGQLSVLPCTEGSCPCFFVQRAVVHASLYRGQLSVFPCTEDRTAGHAGVWGPAWLGQSTKAIQAGTKSAVMSPWSEDGAL